MFGSIFKLRMVIFLQAAERYLLEKDLIFVHEREIEPHIWKTVYYQVLWVCNDKLMNKICYKLVDKFSRCDKSTLSTLKTFYRSSKC